MSLTVIIPPTDVSPTTGTGNAVLATSPTLTGAGSTNYGSTNSTLILNRASASAGNFVRFQGTAAYDTYIGTIGTAAGIAPTADTFVIGRDGIAPTFALVPSTGDATFAGAVTVNGTLTNTSAQLGTFTSTTANGTSGEGNFTVVSSNTNTDIAYGINRAPGIAIRNTSGTANSYGGISFQDGGSNATSSIFGIFENDANNTGSLQFATRPSGGSLTTALTLASTGAATFAGAVTVSTGNLVIGTAGNGIDFSATAGTGTSELLNDYEEGTWTPSFTGSTTNPTVTYAAQSGSYTKIGRQVTVSFEIGTSAQTGGVGSVQIAGLPFTIGVRVYAAVATFNINNSVSGPMGIFAEANAGGSNFALLATGDNTSWTSVNYTDALSATIYVNGSFTYFV